MNDIQRKEMARAILLDRDDSSFHMYSYGELQAFYNAKCECEVVPSTAQCARNEARHILGEQEATRLTIQALGKSRHL